MGWVHTATVIVHVLLAAAIIAFVLIQRGKGADAGAGFGSGASGTVFGARGSANFLSRMTATMAALFFATSLGLSYLGGKEISAPPSVLDRDPVPVVPERPSVAPPPAVSAPAAPTPESLGDSSPAMPPTSLPENPPGNVSGSPGPQPDQQP